MTRFKIVINCGPCEDFVAKCLASVRAQSFTEWEAYVTVDTSVDNTYACAVRAVEGDPRFRVKQNKTRRYSMSNLIQAIRWSDAEPEDVIVSLDGDDWLADDSALQLIAEAYDKFDCWITYGSWLSNVVGPSGRPNGCWPAYPEETTDFRRQRFLGTAVRTWKRWLWDHLRDTDLRSDTGDYVRVSEDQMVMIPLLEMCGTSRAKHIASPIMVYNKLAKYPVDGSITAEGVRNGHLIEARSPYGLLQSKIYKTLGAIAG